MPIIPYTQKPEFPQKKLYLDADVRNIMRGGANADGQDNEIAWYATIQ